MKTDVKYFQCTDCIFTSLKGLNPMPRSKFSNINVTARICCRDVHCCYCCCCCDVGLWWAYYCYVQVYPCRVKSLSKNGKNLNFLKLKSPEIKNQSILFPQTKYNMLTLFRPYIGNFMSLCDHISFFWI